MGAMPIYCNDATIGSSVEYEHLTEQLDAFGLISDRLTPFAGVPEVFYHFTKRVLLTKRVLQVVS
jgi:hypothetical protein